MNSLATASVPHRSSCIKTWKGEAGNVDAAQKRLLARAQANGEALRRVRSSRRLTSGEELRILGAGLIALPLVYLPWC